MPRLKKSATRLTKDSTGDRPPAGVDAVPAPNEMSSQLDVLARAIIASERETNAAGARAVEVAFRKLHEAMVSLVGTAGYAALLRRAIHLTKPKHDWLAQLVIASPFVLERLDEQAVVVGESRALEGGAALLSTFLQLLCTFIGEPLTLRQVHQVWPDISGSGGGSSATKETS